MLCDGSCGISVQDERVKLLREAIERAEIQLDLGRISSSRRLLRNALLDDNEKVKKLEEE